MLYKHYFTFSFKKSGFQRRNNFRGNQNSLTENNQDNTKHLIKLLFV